MNCRADTRSRNGRSFAVDAEHTHTEEGSVLTAGSSLEPIRRERFASDIRRGAHAMGDCLAAEIRDVAMLCGAAGVASLEGVLFLDTETTGLSGGAGTFVFLAGVASFVEGELETRQYVLESPDHEAAFLDAVEAEARTAKLLVTFHGRGFDLPRLEERFLLSRRESPFGALPHLDLLVGARRVFKLRMGRVGLQHLERTVLGVTRLDDLPGAECPAAWYASLRGETAPMDAVLEHNLLDLLSLPPLVAALAEAAAGRAPAHDVHSAGLVFGTSGDLPRALTLQRIASATAEDGSLAARAHAAASHLLRRGGDRVGAAEEALRACAADPSMPGPWLDLAKYAEHALRDCAVALEYARRAESALFLRSRSLTQRAALVSRMERLNRKIAAPR